MRDAGEMRDEMDEERRWEQDLADLRRRDLEIDHAEPIGPQGAALIHELQRIQRAFEQEYRGRPAKAHAERAPHHGRADTVGMHDRRPKRRKGMMNRALDACLRRFGFAALPPASHRPTVASEGRAPTANRPPRLERAGARGMPPQHAREVRPQTSPRARPTPSIAGDRGIAVSSQTHARSAAATLTDAPSIAPGDGMPRDAVRELARTALSIGEGSKENRLVAASQAVKPSLDRVFEACFGHARIGYGYLVGRSGEPWTNADSAQLAPTVRRSFERELRTGLRVLVFGFGIVGGWATFVPLSGAVIAPGNLVVQSNVKKVQHPTGGIVAQIAVHDGMHVNAGDLLARLDETQARANLEMITKQLDEVMIRIARLTAERDDLDEPKMPPELAQRSGDEDAGARFASEKSLFKARATARQGQKQLLQGRIAQLEQQIEGLEAQIKSNASQVDLIAGELQGVQSLFEKRLAPITRLNALQRDSARLEGERGQLQSTIAETKSKIGEAQLQMIRLDQDFRADVIKELREAEGKKAELAERRVAAQDQLNRIDIRAPTAGIVHQLTAHTVGGVIGAREVVMEIVPDADELQVEAHLPPKDIDQIKVGQRTLVRLPAFNQRTTPQLTGVVSYVSADVSHDEKGDTSSYYTVRVTLPEEEHRRLAGLKLVSGMPGEIFVQTGTRTMMSYLLKPITDQLRRAFN